MLSPRNDILVEARRVLLNEELEKISNITLANLHHTKDIVDEPKYQDILNIEPELFWKNLPPKPSVEKLWNKTSPVNFECKPTPNDLKIDKICSLPIKPDVKKVEQDNSCMILQKRYFLQWRKLLKHKQILTDKINCKEKVDNFVRKLKKMNKEPPAATEPIPNPTTTIFTNRFSAQKTIIEMQRNKLQEQNKLIEELKLGIIRDDLKKCLNNTKIDIHEIFNDLSPRIKRKVPHLDPSQDREKLMLNSQKAPKVIQRMEERAIQRANNRQIIFERKRLIDENRKRLLEEAIENKRSLEEAEKKQYLEMIKERRKKELELEKLRQANKNKFLENLKRANLFYRTLLLQRCFTKLFINYVRRKDNYLLAVLHYDNYLKRFYMLAWWKIIDDKWKLKCKQADDHFCSKTIRKCFKIWYHVYFERIRSIQVAKDLYDFRLTSNTFLKWHNSTCKIIVDQENKMKKAVKHYERHLLFYYFYQWRSLPAVIQLEKTKELKKRKWREKVWEILPDFQVPTD